MSTSAQPFLWSLVALPAVGGVLLVSARRVQRFAAPIAVTIAAVVLVLSVVVAATRPGVAVPFVAGADFALRVDGLSAVVVPTIAAVTVLVLLFAATDIGEARGRFHGLMLLFASAALLTATAASLPTLLLAWEVMGAASYALIGFRWRDDFRVSAGLTAFITTRTADLGLYVAAGAAIAGGAGLALTDLPTASHGWRQVVALGVLIAALGKAAQLPFSFWLSRAMEGPSPVSALLHSAAMVAMGAYLLLRVQPLLAATGWVATLTAWVGVTTAVALGAVAVAQRDVKQLLAASTAAQLGFVVMAAGLGAIGAGAAHLIAHAFTKAGLFLAAGVWLSVLGTKQLDDLRGVARRWPLTGWCATVAALTLAGVAPLSLWATKDAVLAAALRQSPGLYAMGLIAAVLSAAYAAKILVVLWRKDTPRPGGLTPTGDPPALPGRRPATQQVPLVILAVGAAAAGLLVLPPAGEVFAGAVGDGPLPSAGLLEFAGSAVLALVVVAAVVRWGVPQPRWASQWLGLEAAATALVVRPTFRLAHALARFDDRVLDRAVDVAATFSLRAAHAAARLDVGAIDATVQGIATRVRHLGELARRPQTGQLHQYYLAAVVVLAAAVLVLVTVR
jgi:NADH-quinone oxidoreductase subunit L